jgi:cytochrome P450
MIQDSTTSCRQPDQDLGGSGGDINMATNGTSALPTLNASRFDVLATPPTALAIAAVLGLLVLYALSPRADPREPPLVKPSIPLIGHILGLMRHQAQYHINLQRATRKPIATLPMLSGKMYAVWDPYLTAAGLRSKALSPTPQALAAVPVIAQTSPHATAVLLGPQGEHFVDRLMQHVISPSLKGAPVHRLNTTALSSIADQLTSLAPSTTMSTPIPNAWLWLRHLITSATTTALYGIHNPFSTSPGNEVETALWDFEKHLLKLTLNLPSFMASTGHRARETLFSALTPYYTSRHDTHPSASDLVRNRAAEIRAAGIPDEDLARLEIMLPFAAMANTVPMLFWLFCHIFSRPDLVARLRQEVERGLVVGRMEGTQTGKGEGGEVAVNVAAAAVEEKCPLLMSCYRETLRLTIHQVSTRTAMQDTVLSDKGGREYLLKKGNVVQLVIGTGHNMEEYWGDGADEFQPERFLGKKGDGEDGPGSSKAMRTAFLPFGGGMHLCPGRAFAFAEMMAVLATLLLGYEIESVEGSKWELPGFATRSVIDAVTKPANHGQGFGVNIKRREGWEGVRWRYEL